MTISHYDHKPSYLSAIMTFIHDANRPPYPLPLPLPLCQSAIMSISHPLCLSEIRPIKHHTYKPLCQSATLPPPLQLLCQSAIMLISHHAYQPLCLSATMPPPLQPLFISVIISCKSDSWITNIRLWVHYQNPSASQNCSYCPSRPTSLSTIEPINHRAYWQLRLSTIKPINHWAYWPLVFFCDF